MEQIRGVALLDIEVFCDGRGDLAVFEETTSLPFSPRRVFYWMPEGHPQHAAQRATSSDLFVTAMAGSVIVDVDNGAERVSVPLATRHRGLWMRPGIFMSLRDPEPGTMLLACASAGGEESLLPGAAQADIAKARVA